MKRAFPCYSTEQGINSAITGELITGTGPIFQHNRQSPYQSAFGHIQGAIEGLELGWIADWQLSTKKVILADMMLWRLTRLGHQTLDGKGAEQSGGRYSSPGLPVVSLASEAGAAVLIALRYWLDRLDEAPDDLTLGWTIIDSTPERVPDGLAEDEIKKLVDDWIIDRKSLLLAVRSKVLPEADIILLNPAHEDAGNVSPLRTRPFNFDECLHRPPMLDAFRKGRKDSD